MSNPILRNLRITLAYYDLSQRLAARTGGDVINWCSMACWSSKSVGTYIRSDELPPELRAVLASHADVNARITDAAPGAAADDGANQLERVAREVLADVSQYLVVGNKIVFAEVGGVFNAFADRFPPPTPPATIRRSKNSWQRSALVTLSPIGSRWILTARTLMTAQQGGQGWLASAARHYYEAAYTQDPKSRAELVLLGNGEIGMHEQTRLDPYLAGSMDAPSVADVVSNRWKTALLNRVVEHEARGRLESKLTEILSDLGKLRAFEDFSTRTMMSLQLPGQLVHMGHDLPAPLGSPLYPPIVEDLQHPMLREVFQKFRIPNRHPPRQLRLAGRLREISDKIGEHPQHHRLSGQPRRIGPIIHSGCASFFPLFRSRHQTMGLLGKPFTDDQIQSIRQRIVPPGTLS